ncbi:MAG: alanine/ornithine racemase family PLP-dependent enzyme, partial [Halanaerobium sp.]|nr:alanine/ornithine racemase family PLP-dependent enzyme [Halanaerobium sp.]
EGVWPDKMVPLLGVIRDLPAIEIIGLGTNLTCYGGVLPTEDNLSRLVELAREAERHLGKPLEIISGGNSSSLPLLLAGRIPEGINQLRIGETILIGNNVNERKPFPGTYQDTFILEAEIVELKIKPSVPIGKRGYDAFGRPTEFADKGEIWRAILAVGEQDIAIDGLVPQIEGVEILGGSSDHLLLDLSPVKGDYQVGDTMAFSLNYEALLHASTSPYVAKVVVKG